MGISVTGRNRGHQTPLETGLFWVGPTRADALAAARRWFPRGKDGPPAGTAVSLAALRRGPADAAARIVLCPAGRSLAGDLSFLREARRLLLWPAPPGLLQDAVAGLLNLPDPDSPRAASSRGPRAAILLEGAVDARRAARALATHEPRLWILPDPRSLRISPREIAAIERRGVRLCALRPVKVEALVASPALAAARSRWKRLLPPRTVAFTAPPVRRSRARSRRSSRR
jgi:hypothetical protein